MRCWAFEPSMRPSAQDICSILPPLFLGESEKDYFYSTGKAEEEQIDFYAYSDNIYQNNPHAPANQDHGYLEVGSSLGNYLPMQKGTSSDYLHMNDGTTSNYLPMNTNGEIDSHYLPMTTGPSSDYLPLNGDPSQNDLYLNFDSNMDSDYLQVV